MNKFLKEFKDRGFFYQCTNEEELSSLMDKEKIKAYMDLIVLLKAYMLVAYYKSCVLDYYKKMAIDLLYY